MKLPARLSVAYVCFMLLAAALQPLAANQGQPPTQTVSSQSSGDPYAAVRAEVQKGFVFWIWLDAATAWRMTPYGYFVERETSTTTLILHTTPNIQTLADDGVVFDRCIVPFPNTVHSFGHVPNSTWDRPAEHAVQPQFNAATPPIPVNSPAALMKLKGYRTLAAEANSYGHWSVRGFDVLRHMHPSGTAQYEYPKHRAEAYLPVVKDWLDTSADGSSTKPLFMWLHYIEPHSPRQTQRPWATMFTSYPATFEEANNLKVTLDPMAYCNNLAYVDHELGKLFDHLKARGLYSSSTIILAADHGEEFGEHGKQLMEAHNANVHREQAHVPLIIKFPESVPLPKKRVAAAVSSIDLMPTMDDLMETRVDTKTWSGKSLLPLVFGGAVKTHDYVFCRAGGDPEVDVWKAHWGLPTGGESTYENLYSIRDERYFLKWRVAPNTVSLYDTIADPGETIDISNLRPEITARMFYLLRVWRFEVPDWIISTYGSGPTSVAPASWMVFE